MSDSTSTSVSVAKLGSENRQFVVIGVVAAVICSALVVGYFLLMNDKYSLLYDGLRSDEAAKIVEELNAQGVNYRLGPAGDTILVPESKVAQTHLAIVSSGVSHSSSDGFELFDTSDMGLTEFGQKIKYQRALQGELTRTILMLGGIKDARVHISIPEKTVFREAQATPKAAVTLVPNENDMVNVEVVAGIRRLVAAAVPELKPDNIVILDEFGAAYKSETKGELVSEKGPIPVDENDHKEEVTTSSITDDQTEKLPVLPPSTTVDVEQDFTHDADLESQLMTEDVPVELARAETPSLPEQIASASEKAEPLPSVSAEASVPVTRTTANRQMISALMAPFIWIGAGAVLSCVMLMGLGLFAYRRLFRPTLSEAEQLQFVDEIRRQLDAQDPSSQPAGEA